MAMPKVELYSDRKKKLENVKEPEVFQYDTISKRCRTQLQQILRDAIGPYREPRGHRADYNSSPHNNNNQAWSWIQKTLCREKGVNALANSDTPARDVLRYIEFADTSDVLDVIDLCCRYIDCMLREMSDYELTKLGVKQHPSEAIEEINCRFREEGLGFQFENGEIMRVDCQYLHADVVKPALSLLIDPRFSGPNQEFLEAHRHLRIGNAQDAIVWANRAFESTMKAVCDIRGWCYDRGARVSDLYKILKANGLWPTYLDIAFDQLLSTLKSGLPKVRDNVGAHGQGAQPKNTPLYVAAYALHLAATNIVFIVTAALHSSNEILVNSEPA